MKIGKLLCTLIRTDTSPVQHVTLVRTDTTPVQLVTLCTMIHHAPVSDATDHELELRGSGRWRQNYQVAYIVSFADVFFLNVT